jgi:hypothetical protein
MAENLILCLSGISTGEISGLAGDHWRNFNSENHKKTPAGTVPAGVDKNSVYQG